MTTMRLSTQPQQQSGRLPHPLSASRPTCKIPSFGNTAGNYLYEQAYHPSLCSKPNPASISGVPCNPSPSLFNRSAMNQLRLKQYNFLASLVNNNTNNTREQMLKRQLMKAVMSQQSSVDYLDFLRRYAEDANGKSSSNIIRQEFDYLDYIRRDAAEEFKRNGVEVPYTEDSRVTDPERCLGVVQLNDTNLTSPITTSGKGRESTENHIDSAIISHGDFFSTTSMNNHEPQQSDRDTYTACPQKLEKDFSIAPPASQGNASVRNHRNIFRNSRSHRRRRSTSAKHRDSSERRPLSRPCKTVSSAGFGSAVSRKPKRSKPYDGFQRNDRSGATGNHNEKPKQSYAASRNINPYDSDNSSSKTPK